MQSLLLTTARRLRTLPALGRTYRVRRPKVWLTSLELGGLIILMLWIGIGAKHLENRALDLDSAKRDLHNFALLFEENALRSVGEINKAILYLRNSIEMASGTPSYPTLVLTADVLSELIVQVAIIDEHGLMQASNAGPRPGQIIDLSDREHYLFHRSSSSDELYISKPLIGRASGKLSVQLTRRFSKKDGSFGGVVVVSFDPAYFKKLYGRVDLGSGATYALIGTDGIVRAVGGQERDPISVGRALQETEALQGLQNNVSLTYWDAGAGKEQRDFVVLRKVAGHPLAVSARVPKATVFRESTHSLVMMSLVGLAVSLLTAITAWRGFRLELQSKLKAEQLQLSHGRLRENHAKLVDLNFELQQSEAEAHRQKLLFQSLFENTPDGLVHVDTDHRIINLNPAFTDMFGYSIDELRGKSLQCLFASREEFDVVVDHLAAAPKGPLAAPLRCARKTGGFFPARVNGARMSAPSGEVTGFLGVIRDVTVEQKRESALRQRQHLEALGRLTGGIAHDFNNLLTVISGNIQLVDMETDPERRSRFLAQAEHATVMGARLNQRLMTFARQRRLDPVSVDLNILVGDLLDLIRRSIGEKITVSANLAAAPSAACIDESEMENAILNLALNARDAMESGGSLSIETSSVDIDSNEPNSPSDIPPGKYVRLSVADTGSGMSKDVAARAFEPFFTTKPEGKGIGLGLTTIHGFIKQSGGHVALSSEVGRGTAVSIYLPRPSADSPKASRRANGLKASGGQGQIILLVEDNSAVRNVTKERLKLLGYSVIATACGAEALEVVARGEPIDLVFSDIVMPGGISGIELAKRLGQLRPHLQVLLTSGFADDTARLEAPDDEQLVVLRKPYSQDELARRIATALGQA